MTDAPWPSHHQGDDRLTIATPGLRIDFRRSGERWTHVLSLEGAEGPIPVVRAIEGDSRRDSPTRVVSPSYQEIHWHEAASGGQALLTGQATPHHFSAVVSSILSDDGVALEFDVADRCRGPIEALAATYQVEATSSDLVDAGNDRIVWESPRWPAGRLELTVEGHTRVGLAEAGRLATQVQVQAELAGSGHTHRFVYRWRWRPKPED